MLILAIDPGNTHSGYALIHHDDHRPIRHGKAPNDEVLRIVQGLKVDHLAIEMVASYGMAVGATVFETCVWIGRYLQANADYQPSARARLVYRRDVKLHHCHSAKAKDSNIAQALVDRFAPGAPNRGKGTKAQPGWFHGFAADVWQAYALAVLVADQLAAASTTAATSSPSLLTEAPF